MANSVEEIERRLYLLKEKFGAGAISAEQFEFEVQKLQFRDRYGTIWMIGAQSGLWYYHDGKQWMQADPPRAQPSPGPRVAAEPGTQRAVAVVAPQQQAQQRTKGSMQWLLFGCTGLAVVFLILAVALIGAIYLTSEDTGQATATSALFLPVPDLPTPTATLAAPVMGNPTPTLALANDVTVLLQEARDLMSRSQYEDAVARYQKASGLDPAQATIYARWARALRLQYPPQLEEALGKAIVATQLDPNNVEGLTELAWLNYLLGRKDEAISAGQRALRIDANYVPAHVALSTIYLNVERSAEGLAEARRALELDPNSAEAHLAMAYSYAFAGQADTALAEIQQAITLEPDVAHHYVELGVQLRRMERFDEAIQAYQSAIKLYPKLATAYDGLGRAYFSGPGDYDKALEAFRKAVELAPNQASAYSGMGYVYLVQGEADEAQNAFNQALALAPNMQEAKDGLKKVVGEPITVSSPTPEAKPTEMEKPPAVASAAQPSAQGNTEERPSAPERPTKEAEPTAQPASQLSGTIYFPVYHQDQASYDIYRHNADGSGDSSFVLGEASQPAASWDGTALAVRRWKRDSRGIVAMGITGPAQGSDYRRLTAQAFVEDSMPAWSPDGGSIIFSSRRESDRQSRLYITPSGGGQERALEQNFKPVIGVTPSWLKDGRVIYSGCIQESCGLIAINPDGAGPTNITDHWSDSQPAGSPDGSRIAFMSQREGNWEIFVVNVDGSNMARLTNNRVNDGMPCWSPDGNFIAFASDEGGTWGIWVVNADGSNRRKLFDVPGSVDGRVAGEDDTKSRGWLEERMCWVP